MRAGLFTAFLTAFYMARMFVVVFLNRPTTKEAEHAHEVPAVMAGPLVILAVPAAIAGYGIVARRFGLGEAHAESLHPAGGHLLQFLPVLAPLIFAAGAVCGILLYWGRTRDPIRIGVLRHKFYFDEFYAALIRVTQDALAKLSAWVDRWVIDGVGVRGVSGGVWGSGFVLRFLQVGNLQAYAFFFGVGVLVLVYMAILS